MTTKLFVSLGLLLLPVFASAALDTQKQRYSYTVGAAIGNQLKAEGEGLVDLASFIEGLSDVFNGEASQLSDEQKAQARIKQRELKIEAKKMQAAESLEQGKVFLQKNQSKPGVITLPSGLQYAVAEQGEGVSPKAGDKVKVHYHGTLPDGTVFDSSIDRGEPAVFGVDQVIKGFSGALKMMSPGARWRVFIPSELGYGKRGAGSKIGPNQVLIFDLELLEILDR